MVFTRFLGVTDEVPGVFYVATKFCSLKGIPLAPIQSCIVLNCQRRAFRIEYQVVALPKNDCKSISLAYARFATAIGVILSMVCVLAVFTNDTMAASKATKWRVGTILSLLVTLGVAFVVGFHWRKASYERATELVQYLGPHQRARYQRAVDVHFARLASTTIVEPLAEENQSDCGENEDMEVVEEERQQIV